MSTARARLPHIPWVSPYIIVNDVDSALAFYSKAFHCVSKEDAVKDDTGTTVHAGMYYNDQLLMLGKAGAYGGKSKSPAYTHTECSISLYVYCENVDEFYKHAVAAGAHSISPPDDTFWGDRMCRLQDPDGYLWSFATHIGE